MPQFRSYAGREPSEPVLYPAICRSATARRTPGRRVCEPWRHRAAAPPWGRPSAKDLQRLVEQSDSRVGQLLERRRLIERDMENAWFTAGAEPGPLDVLLSHSITYRTAMGSRARQRLFTLKTVPPGLPGPEDDANGAARAGGFCLHAAIDIKPAQRDKLERPCRLFSRPPAASERLALTSAGSLHCALETPYRDGTTHIVLEPLGFIAREAALVSPPRMHLTRFHGVIALHRKLRAAVTPAHRGMGRRRSQPLRWPSRRHRGMWRRAGRAGSNVCLASRSSAAPAALASPRSSPASRSRGPSRRSSCTSIGRRRNSINASCRSEYGRCWCSPRCHELEAQGRLRWSLTRRA